MNDVLYSRLFGSYFPPLDSLWYGEVTDAGVICEFCSKHISSDENYAYVTACSHSFHQICLESYLSDQFRPAGLRASLGHWPEPDTPFANWILQEFCPPGSAATAKSSSESHIPMDAKLVCPHCGCDIDYTSMRVDNFDQWVVNEEGRFKIQEMIKELSQ